MRFRLYTGRRFAPRMFFRDPAKKKPTRERRFFAPTSTLPIALVLLAFSFPMYILGHGYPRHGDYDG